MDNYPTLEAPLSLAAELGYDDIVDLLLKESAGDSIRWKLNAESLSRAFLHASIAKNRTLMEILLSRGAEVNETDFKGRTALMMAVKRDAGKSARWHLLAKVGEDTSPEDIAATLACAKDTLDLVNFLLANGADVNVISEKGKSSPINNTRYRLTLFRQNSIELCRFGRECRTIGDFITTRISAGYRGDARKSIGHSITAWIC